MSFSLLNFGMLAGLLAIAIPIAVHFLNRRRFDVVEWGAMQFLKLGQRTRQKIKLSDLLLLLLRIVMVALLVMVFTRPFLQGNTFIRSLYPEPVDLVIVIDSSYSMGWTGEEITPHARAIQACHNMLDHLTTVDRVAIIDARGRPELLTPPPLTDPASARLELEKIQQPDGTANLTAAATRACQLLTQSYSTRRDIVILTDGQSRSWQEVGAVGWNEFLRLRQSAAVPIQLAAVDVGSEQMNQLENFRVDRVKASRDVAVTGTEITFTTRVGYEGPLDEKECELNWAIDGQLLSRETDQLNLQKGEEAVAELTTRFSDAGTHIVTASLNEDALPGDNVSQFVVKAVSEIPVLIAVPNSRFENPRGPDEDPFSEYYLSRVFGDADREQVWVDARVVPQERIDADLLKETEVLFWIGPGSETIDWEEVNGFLQRGGGMVFLPERGMSNEQFANMREAWRLDEQTVLPVPFEERREIEETPQKLDLNSLSASWLDPFRDPEESELADVLINHFWPINLSDSDQSDQEEETGNKQKKQPRRLGDPTVIARLENGSPVFVQRDVGRGQLLLSALSLDGLDSNLIRMRTFVPLMHELVFSLARTSSDFNIELSQAIIVQELPCQPLSLDVRSPTKELLKAQRSGRGEQLTWRLSNLNISGIYEVQVDCEAGEDEQTGPNQLPFSAFASRDESALARLTAEERNELRTAYDLTWQANSGEVLDSLAEASGGIEVWPLLLFLVSGLLVFELCMTRRLVQGGHHQVELDEDELQPAH